MLTKPVHTLWPFTLDSVSRFESETIKSLGLERPFCRHLIHELIDGTHVMD